MSDTFIYADRGDEVQQLDHSHPSLLGLHIGDHLWLYLPRDVAVALRGALGVALADDEPEESTHD